MDYNGLLWDFENFESMTPLRLLLVMGFFLLASVPWFYIGGSSASDEGLPDWALHTFLVTVLFALFIVYALRKYWESMAEDRDNPQLDNYEG